MNTLRADIEDVEEFLCRICHLWHRKKYHRHVRLLFGAIQEGEVVMASTDFPTPQDTPTVYVSVSGLDNADGTASTDTVVTATYSVVPDSLAIVVASTVVPTDGVITIAPGQTGTVEVSVSGTTASGNTFTGYGTITLTPVTPVTPLTATLSFTTTAPVDPATPPVTPPVA